MNPNRIKFVIRGTLIEGLTYLVSPLYMSNCILELPLYICTGLQVRSPPTHCDYRRTSNIRGLYSYVTAAFGNTFEYCIGVSNSAFKCIDL